MPSGSDLISAAKSRIREISPKDAAAKHGSAVFLDVREPQESNLGTIPGAVLCPRGMLEVKVEGLLAARDAEIVVYCAGGGRSALAADTLQQMGYTNVVSLAGGFRDWAMSGGAVDD
jgi:rhodanese-related sulfurtransferase